VPPIRQDIVETRERTLHDARAEPEDADHRRDKMPPPPRAGEEYMRGASQPAFRTHVPPPIFPKPPLVPRIARDASELAEQLSLPPGVHGASAGSDAVPKSLLEARAQFTLLSRELGRDYRVGHDFVLRTDLDGIEAMQRRLHEAFPNSAIRTSEQALTVRRHGAFLSEILARTLGAEWVDIAPSELGYWSMIVPPNTRIQPFGRVLRLIAMGHKERDLVSYYLELEARAQKR
jgi:hypothetical protein